MYFLIRHLSILIIGTLFIYPALPLLDNTPSPDKFTFAVVGDQHGANTPDVPEQFFTILKELSILRPDFVVSTGDMIEGSEDDEAEIKRRREEWENAVGTYLDGISFFPTAGNNDIWSEFSADVYRRIVGPLWYSFDYGGCHFVVMCSEEPGYTSGVSPAQKSWLKADLKANADASFTFCFIHKPLWYRGEEDGEKQWYDEIHPVLVEGGVDYLFSGHRHVYEDYGLVDGVHYLITGGGGGTLDTGRPDHLGPFYHYLLVTVDGEDVDISVVKIGSILPSDVVTSEMVDGHNKAMALFAHKPVFEVDEGFNYYDGKARFSLENPFDVPVTGTIEWEISAKGWVVYCPSNFILPPGGRKDIPITVSYQGVDPIYVEWPKYKASYDIPSLVGGPFAAEGKLHVVPKLTVHQSPRQITIDGDLSDWWGIDSVILADAKHIGMFEEWRPDELSAVFQLTWDTQHLYFACEVTDDVHYQPYPPDDPSMWMGDIILMGFDLYNADTEDYGDADFELALSLHNGEPGFNARRASKGSSIKALQGMDIAITREWEFTRYEFSISRDTLPRNFLVPGAKIGFSVLISDNDGDGWAGFIEWNPGALTYGKDLASFATLTFQP